MERRTCFSHDCRNFQALLCQPSALGSHLPEGSVHPLDVDSWDLLGFKPDGGYEVVRLHRVGKLYFLDLGRVEAAVDGAAQAMFAEKMVNELSIWGRLCVCRALGFNAFRRVRA